MIGLPGSEGLVNTINPIITGELYERVCRVLPKNQPVYLVGGAVRDALLGRRLHDLDYALDGDPRPVARRVANELGGAYYLLDDERNTGRVILTQPGGDRVTLDFARLRGVDLEADLRDRDFTINAMAVEVESGRPADRPPGWSERPGRPPVESLLAAGFRTRPGADPARRTPRIGPGFQSRGRDQAFHAAGSPIIGEGISRTPAG